jgi:hypothetical protein
MPKKSLAILALTVGAFLALPTAAYAVAPYPPVGPCASVSGTAAPDATITVTFTDGCFAADEQYDVTVTGSGTVTLDGVAAASLRKAAAATGGGTLVLALPHDATGTYVVNAVGILSQRIWSATVDVAPITPAIATPSAPVANTPVVNSSLSSTSLASTWLAATGRVLPALTLWGAGGLILLGAAMMMRAARRAQSNSRPSVRPASGLS